jgi:hypothetical protein
MDKKYIAGAVVGAVIIAGAGFYAGQSYAKSSIPARGVAGQFAGRAGGTGAARGGFTVGNIVSKDANSITIQMQDGSTKIILMSTSTAISKNSAGTAADLLNGTGVMVSGSTNSDGSITAQSIQIRPALPPTRQPAQ